MLDHGVVKPLLGGFHSLIVLTFFYCSGCCLISLVYLKIRRTRNQKACVEKMSIYVESEVSHKSQLRVSFALGPN